MAKKIIFIIICFLLFSFILVKINEREEIYLLPVVQEEQNFEFEYTQNIPIPKDIQDMLDETWKKELLKQEELAKQEEIRQQEEFKSHPIIKENTSRSSQDRTEKQGEYMKFTATGYCPCEKCCGVADGLTASGKIAESNHTVAMPKSYSFGTKIEIKNYGMYVVEDRGGAIKGNKIDIFFDTHEEALTFGKRTVYLKVVE